MHFQLRDLHVEFHRAARCFAVVYIAKSLHQTESTIGSNSADALVQQVENANLVKQAHGIFCVPQTRANNLALAPLMHIRKGARVQHGGTDAHHIPPPLAAKINVAANMSCLLCIWNTKWRQLKHFAYLCSSAFIHHCQHRLHVPLCADASFVCLFVSVAPLRATLTPAALVASINGKPRMIIPSFRAKLIQYFYNAIKGSLIYKFNQ